MRKLCDLPWDFLCEGMRSGMYHYNLPGWNLHFIVGFNKKGFYNSKDAHIFNSWEDEFNVLNPDIVPLTFDMYQLNVL